MRNSHAKPSAALEGYSRLKLLIYSHFFAPSIGGVENIVLSLARGLAELRSPDGEAEFDVTLVCKTPSGEFNDASLPFRVVRSPGVWQLRRLIRRSDVVHVAGPSLLPLFLSWIAGTPVVIEHHGYQAICPNGVFLQQPARTVCPGHFLARHYGECLRCVAHESSRLRSWQALLLMFPRYFLTQRAAANLAISKHMLKRFEFRRSSVVYHGIDDPLKNAAESRASRISPAKICFAYVGRLVPEKGIPVLLEATKILRDEGHEFDVRLVGEGPERPQFEAIIARDRLENLVRITGFLTGDALAEALSSVSVVVMPSIWEETAGLAAIEQMWRGRLVIASDIGGLGEIVGEAGLKCAPGDAKALADAMRRVIQQPSVITSVGEAARARALRLFRRERMIAEHARTYRELRSRGLS